MLIILWKATEWAGWVASMDATALVMQEGVRSVRQQGGGPSDAQHCADVERTPDQQMAGRDQTHLRRRQDETFLARSQHEAVRQLGWTGTGRAADRRRSDNLTLTQRANC